MKLKELKNQNIRDQKELRRDDVDMDKNMFEKSSELTSQKPQAPVAKTPQFAQEVPRGASKNPVHRNIAEIKKEKDAPRSSRPQGPIDHNSLKPGAELISRYSSKGGRRELGNKIRKINGPQVQEIVKLMKQCKCLPKI